MRKQIISRSIIGLCVSFTLFAFIHSGQAGDIPGNAKVNTGGLKDNGAFSGYVGQNRCKGPKLLPITGKVNQDGTVTGTVHTAKRNNPPEKSNIALQYSFTVRDDGSFGGSSGDENRFWLRYHSTGAPKYQWISGITWEDKVLVKIRYGSPGISKSFCNASGVFTLDTAAVDRAKIVNVLAKNPDLCKGDKSAITSRVKDQLGSVVKKLEKAGEIQKGVNHKFSALNAVRKHCTES